MFYTSWNPYLTLVISVCGSLLALNCKKVFIASGSGNRGLHLFDSLLCAIAAGFLILFGGGIGTISTYTLLLGILFGVVTAGQLIFNMLALRIGPLSYTTVIISLSCLIPALSGCLFFHEEFTLQMGVGIVFMAVCLVLSVDKKKNEKKGSVRWLIFCAHSFVMCGAIGIIQKIHSSSAYQGETVGFLIIAFAFSCLTSLVLFFLSPKEPSKKTGLPLPLLGVIALATGLGVSIENLLNLYLSGALPSAVFFPTVNGSVLILAILSGVILFRERHSNRTGIGLAFGVAAILLLCLKF